MSTTAFPVRQSDDGTGCTDLTMRMILASLYPSVGVVSGLVASGTDGLSYSLSPGVAVLSRGASDGHAVAYWDGGEVEVSANASSLDRIDAIWLSYHDLTKGDEDNLVVAGVAEGTPSASPVEPAVPSGAVRVAAMLLPGGSTSTSAATAVGETDPAIPYGGALGLLGEFVDNYSADQVWDSQWWAQGTVTVTVPTRRVVELVYETRTYTKSGADSSYYLKAQVDGADVTDGLDERPVMGRFHVRDQWRLILELPAGTHTVGVLLRANTNEQGFTWDGVRSTRVWDRGVA